ncbi:MAG: CpXC domain-containing protein [Anaeroplasmataceae bacterium]
MSESQIIKITCPKCNRVIDFKAYLSVNVTKDKHLKEEVLNFNIFNFQCECELKSKAFYPVLYHDMEKKAMIQYAHGSIFDYIEQFKKLRMDLGYRYRIVDDPYLLIEKILIFDTDYDDRVLEIMKEFVIASCNVEGISKLLFAKNKDNTYSFLALDKNGCSMGTIPFEGKLYDMVFEKFFDLLDNKSFIIDQDYARKFLEEVKL